MSILLHGDCLEELKGVDDDSVDLVFCDLPYGQTGCKWDTPIDLDKFWVEIMRVKKLHTPVFMTCTTKFGASLITSAPKKCQFRYDLVWIKSCPCGFLSAKKMPMRKHEMIYVFYEKLPFYDLSSHKHKFLDKEVAVDVKDSTYGSLKIKPPKTSGSRYDPALPDSVVKEDGCYGEKVSNSKAKYGQKCAKQYDPPLPVSMIEIKTVRKNHSTEKPVALMEWIFKYYSKEGDVVLDPTMGSGSTGVACKNMNRNFIGIEMDAEIYEIAVNRIDD